MRATAQPAADGTLVVMEGWAEKETSDRVDALLEQYPNVIYLKSDPTPEDDTPVKLKNNRFARVFEFVGDMYARPKYGTMDLTPFFAPFYMLFFGICLNDAGYGAILTLLGAWMLSRNRKPGMMRQAAWFATLCGAMTVAFGLLCGSFFGINMKEWFPGIPFFDFQGRFFSICLLYTSPLRRCGQCQDETRERLRPVGLRRAHAQLRPRLFGETAGHRRQYRHHGDARHGVEALRRVLLRGCLLYTSSAGVEVGWSKQVKTGFKVGPKEGGYYISFSDADLEALLSEYLREKVSRMLFKA